MTRLHMARAALAEPSGRCCKDRDPHLYCTRVVTGANSEEWALHVVEVAMHALHGRKSTTHGYGMSPSGAQPSQERVAH